MKNYDPFELFGFGAMAALIPLCILAVYLFGVRDYYSLKHQEENCPKTLKYVIERQRTATTSAEFADVTYRSALAKLDSGECLK